MTRFLPKKVVWLAVAAVALAPGASSAASPTAEQALKLTPIQPGVDYDRPSPEEAAKCKILPGKFDGHVGWIVEGPSGVILRKFVDTNDDNIVDQWSYYKDGLEVYRDIDSNFNGKADQYRWFHTGGSRWGVGAKEDGSIDYWKSISAEEVSAEVIAAIATHDADRFARLVLAPAELKSLGLGRARAESVAEKTQKAIAGFKDMSIRQKAVGPDAVWVQLSASRPGVVPAGTDGSTKDLRVYENAVAVIESGGKHGQVQIGTLVQVGDAWRVIDLPQIAGQSQADATPSGLLLPGRDWSDAARRPAAVAARPRKNCWPTWKTSTARRPMPPRPTQQASLTSRRADLLEQIAAVAKTADERSMWLRQVADTISAAVQSGTCPDGAERLKTLFEKLQKSDADKALAAYVRFRQLTAGYVLGHAGEEGRLLEDSGRVAENVGTVHQRLSGRGRCRRGHAPVGHQPGVHRTGRRREEVVRADRRASSPIRRRRRRRPGRRPGSSRSASRSCSAAKARWEAPSIWRSTAARWC